MSRFFAGGSSDSETSSSDEELYSESEEEKSEEELSEEESEEESTEEDESEAESSDEDEAGGFLKAGAKGSAARFLRGEESEESDEDESRRVVKSAKDKRLEEIDAIIRTIDNAKKINDWVHISNEFDKLNKIIAKASQQGDTPKTYIKAIAELEDFMNETIKTEKDSKKKMNATNARALNSIKQRIKKNNRQYEDLIAKFRADPDGFVNEVEEILEPVAPVKLRKGAEFEAAAAAIRPGVATTAEDISDAAFSTIGRGGRTITITPDSIFKQLRAVLEARGKKNTDRAEQIRNMEKMLDVATTIYQKIRVLLVLVATRFDLTTSTASYMPMNQWKSAQEEVSKLLEILEENPLYVVQEDAEDFDDDDEEEPIPKDGMALKIFGSIISLVERLDDEFTRSLQNIDPHTPEYIDRLKEESVLYSTIIRSQVYFERAQLESSVSRVLVRRLELLYYKPEQLVLSVEKLTWSALPKSLDSAITPRSEDEDASRLINAICVKLYNQDNRLFRTRAMLCHVYHHALHNRYFHARDLLLMSHLQATIHTADISTQILYNRTLVQVGLCAFREGMISECQQALQEICGTGRVKELLAQGIQMQRYAQTSPEQEKIERQRQIPFHMHINLELLECVYLTSSMLLEMPFMAQSGSSPDAKKKAISKPFRRMLDYHERQVFTGPPENTRDHIMQASKALATGDWAKARELIRAIKIWDLIPDTDKIKDMLGEKIQDEGLRTYLFTYGQFYETLSIVSLASMFDMSEGKATALVSKMISNNEIAAALDQKTNAVAFIPGVEYSRLQNLALALSDKAVQLIDSYKYR
ncbi:eukaryotic translation initiation factor 3 subunit 8 N-terminus-domain-containing protein [Lipomyces tetrasporus]|uniref:Eukaryotic translation initiation factor 3 subunit C n=1 Tax=Lipomyces tetrasporus TaxID=54092 RepID=A0AAD7QPA8_9ASCO|nr:eukaryotic translation initiation factor 3 subunit 8 N-terminus-domain-containing protein [Lipomyces tetrasporus]KAJ8098823.1 eukaryotic translation initiation factor 3 subunit 8 N-terminus-domain-containing protein [Lipomyces tetrasporus]